MRKQLHSIYPSLGSESPDFQPISAVGFFLPMSKKTEFWKHYEHPLWQKKRAEILARDGYKCVCCGGTETQLHIHHLYYVSARKPWEYPLWSLSARCKDCHKAAHEDGDGELGEWEWAIEWITNGSPSEKRIWSLGIEIATCSSDGLTDDQIFGGIERFLKQMRETMTPNRSREGRIA
jgi:hypothetical protein